MSAETELEADIAAALQEAERLAASVPGLALKPPRPSSERAGVHRARRAGAGYDFWQHRPYAAGDAPTSIDWRRSAKSDAGLLVRDRERETAAGLAAWIDPSASMAYRDRGPVSKRRRALELALAFAEAAARSGEPVSLLANGPARRISGRGAAAELAGEFRTQKDTPPARPLPGAATVLIASDFFFDRTQIEPFVLACAERGLAGVFLAVNDPSETALGLSGRVEIEDVEGGPRLKLEAANALKSAYDAAFEENLKGVADLAARAGWRLIATRTDEPAEAAFRELIAHLAAPLRGGA
ncbi:MAG: DUF58 domain-containing protein [Pseudomonadota bacterium]